MTESDRPGGTRPGPDPEPAELTELAVRLARQAGELALRRREQGLSVDTKSSPTDVVTDADRAVEELLRTELAGLRPDDAVLGEEGGAAGPAGSRVRWLIDPIDGTVNFLLGLPQYAVSIAAQLDGRTVAGCVHNPASGELFSASLGGGAYLDGRRLTGPRAVPLAEAVLATGFGYDQQLRARQAQLAARLLGRVGNLRRLGSAALDLCFLAAGRLDLYYEGPLGEWDYAAGLLIAQESGAATSGLAGRPAGSWLIAAANPAVAEEFFGLLAESGALELPGVG
ncbi:MAG TPA: inositol monophosphatase family protein [Jatrophihabitans sp.]|nr:inositol monophosphatase family protein [Jatrophihabitans sp.]